MGKVFLDVFELRGNGVADQFLGRLDVEGGSGEKALPLSVRFDVFGDVGFEFGNTLDKLAASREDVTKVVLVIGGGCWVVRGAGGS